MKLPHTKYSHLRRKSCVPKLTTQISRPMGMPKKSHVFFNENPAFSPTKNRTAKINRLAWFSDKAALISGWAAEPIIPLQRQCCGAG